MGRRKVALPGLIDFVTIGLTDTTIDLLLWLTDTNIDLLLWLTGTTIDLLL